MAIKPKLQSLLDSANEVTGQERDNLTDAVQDLVDGYGHSEEESTVLDSTSNVMIQVPSLHWIDVTNRYLLKSNKSTNLVIDMTNVRNQFRVIHRLKLSQRQIDWMFVYSDSNSNGSNGIILGVNGDTNQRIFVSGGSNQYIYMDTILNFNEWYYIVSVVDVSQSLLIVSLYSDSGTLIEVKFAPLASLVTIGSMYESTFNNSDVKFKGERDLSSILYESDGIALWGKTNNKTQQMGFYNFTNPSEFTKVDWLETTGTQLLDTGIYVQPTIKFDMDINVYMDVTDAGGNAFFMSNWDTSVPTGAIWSFRREPSGNWVQTLGNDTQGDTIAYGSDQMHSVHIESGRQTFDEVQYGTRTITSSYSSKTIKIGGGDFRWVSGNHFSHCRIGEIEIGLGSTPTRWLIPVYHNATGTRGAFDAVNNQFHANVGTGVFGIPSDTSNEINLAEYLASLT